MIVIGGALVVAVVLSLVRVLIGPTFYDRALAVNMAVICAALLCALASVMVGRPALLDACFALVLAAITANVAILKYFQTRTFQPPMTRSQGSA